MKYVFVDGYSIINRAFYGMPPMNNSAGTPTGAIYGFISILFHFLDEEKPDYLAVAFDVSAPTFRHEMYKEYKGTRKPFPDDLKAQIPILRELLTAMQIPIVEMKGYEADDVLGTLANLAEKEGGEVSIISGDRDLLQIATDHIKIRVPKTKGGQTIVEDYFAEDVKRVYSLTTAQYIEYKALLGDTSDNVPGLTGVGEKTATSLLLTYGSIDGIYEHVEEIKKPALKNNIINGREGLMLSLKLVTIDKEVPLTLSLSDLSAKEHYTDEAYRIMKELELKSFYKRFEKSGSVEAHREVSVREITDKASLLKEMNMRAKEDCAIVLKSVKSDSLKNNADGQMSLTFEEPKNNTLVFVSYGEDVLFLNTTEDMTGAFKESDIHPVVFGAKELYDYIDYSDKVTDVKVAAYLINPLTNSYSVGTLSGEYLGEITATEEEFLGKADLKTRYELDITELTHFYALYTDQLYRMKKPVMEKLTAFEMLTLYKEIEMPLTYVLYRMEKEGILVVPSRLKEYSKELGESIDKLQKTIYEEAGCEFNIQSPKQLGEVLFDKLAIPGGKKTKSGYSTAADELEKLSGDYPIVTHILEYRALTKLKSTYADSLASFIKEDGKIHTSFHQTITATGRLSSSDPNLQNIPIRSDLGRRIRKAFVPKEGHVFVDADYSQIELRILAHMSGDEQLINAYRESADIHAITASKVFHVPVQEVTPLMRRNAKAVNFGIVYGISSFGLGQDLSISKKEAQQYIDDYFLAYPGIKKFLDDSVSFAKKNGYSLTMYGRRRPIPELKAEGRNFMQRQFGERVAMNAPVQGTAADIMKLAMLRVFDRLEKDGLSARLILQIHDELLIEAPLSEEEAVKTILREEMAKAAELSVPLETDVHSGADWYEAK